LPTCSRLVLGFPVGQRHGPGGRIERRLQRRFGLHGSDEIDCGSAPQWGNQTPYRGRRHLSKRHAIVRLVGALLLEQNDEWAVQRARYMSLETIAQMSDDPTVMLSAVPDA
jgi:hypothetical protein